MTRYFFVAAAMFLAACATVPSDAPPYSRAPDPPAGQSNVYIYRIGAYPTLRAPMIQIDGKDVISPAERAYTVIPLQTGTHEMVVDWAKDTGWPDLRFEIEVEDGTPLFIKITGSFENTSHQTGAAYSYIAGSIVQKPTQQTAEAELATCCRYVRPRTTP